MKVTYNKMFINFWKFLKAFSPEAGPAKSTQEIKTHTKLPFDQRDLSTIEIFQVLSVKTIAIIPT